MKVITPNQFDVLLKEAPIKPRFKRDLKFRLSTEQMDEAAWDETELLPIWNKSKSGGVVIAQPAGETYIFAFDATKPDTDSTGRSKSVICDLCYTWQAGKNGGFVTFYPDKSGDHSVSLLCCMDLACSDNVRTKTAAALKSRTQLRESITAEDRVLRLQHKLAAFIERLGIEGVLIIEETNDGRE
jgi:hypothetical protein